MTRDRERNSMVAMFSSIGWPLILGLAACTLFYAAIFQGVLGSELVRRYFAGHPVAFAATGMFWVGLAALTLKLINLCGQIFAMPSVGFDIDRGTSLPVATSSEMLDQLDDLPRVARQSHLGRRLHAALEHVERNSSAAELDDELKYLADMDAVRQHESYALVRIIIWATPMLGFLGTVVGITQALGDLDPTMLATAIQTAMEGLLAGLYIAFDTTALALSLSIVLMFFQFFVDRIETQILSTVDSRVSEELVGCFETVGSDSDPHLQSVERMAHKVIEASNTLVARQADIWRQSIESVQQRWAVTTEESSEQVQASLKEALDGSLSTFAARLSETEQQAAERAEQRWGQWQTALSQNARTLQAQQHELVQQGEVLGRVLDATADVIKLETTLNQNLKSLAGAKNFEDTVMSLAAAIHLLNTRLSSVEPAGEPVDLNQKASQGRAA